MAENTVKPTQLPWAEFRKGCLCTEARRLCVWELQCLGESCHSLQILWIWFRVLRGHKTRQATQKWLSCSWDSCVPHWIVKWLLQYFYFTCYAFLGFLSMLSLGRDKNQQENHLCHTILLTAVETVFILHLPNRSSPLFFGGAPRRSRLRIPPLFCGRNSPWRRYVFHTPGGCRASNRQPLCCSLGRIFLQIIPCILIVKRK